MHTFPKKVYFKCACHLQNNCCLCIGSKISIQNQSPGVFDHFMVELSENVKRFVESESGASLSSSEWQTNELPFKKNQIKDLAIEIGISEDKLRAIFYNAIKEKALNEAESKSLLPDNTAQPLKKVIGRPVVAGEKRSRKKKSNVGGLNHEKVAQSKDSTTRYERKRAENSSLSVRGGSIQEETVEFIERDQKANAKSMQSEPPVLKQCKAVHQKALISTDIDTENLGGNSSTLVVPEPSCDVKIELVVDGLISEKEIGKYQNVASEVGNKEWQDESGAIFSDIEEVEDVVTDLPPKTIIQLQSGASEINDSAHFGSSENLEAQYPTVIEDMLHKSSQVMPSKPMEAQPDDVGDLSPDSDTHGYDTDDFDSGDEESGITSVISLHNPDGPRSNRSKENTNEGKNTCFFLDDRKI